MQLLKTLHHTHHLSYRRLLLCLLSIGLLLIVAACGTTGNTGNSSPTPRPSPTRTATTSTPTSSTPPVTSASCPAPGAARAIVMPSLPPGTRANIAYFKNESNSDGSPIAVFYRYDLQAAGTTTIAVEKEASIQDAQLSRDGQWILFTAQLGHQSLIQLVRIDGKQLQTLYCAAPGTHIITQGMKGTTSPTQWSPDAKHLVFLQGASMASSKMLLLTLASGSLQSLLTAGPVNQYQPRTWLDNARIYVSSSNVVPAKCFQVRLAGTLSRSTLVI